MINKKDVSLSFLVFLFCLYGQVFGEFVDRTAEFGLNGMSTRAAAWGDFDKDTYSDLYDGSTLWRNNHGTNFTPLVGYGRGIWGDYDNDGYLDIFVLAGNSFIMQNLCGTGFTQVALPTLPTTYNRGASWADFDNNGYLDLYVGGYENGGYQPDFMLSNNQGAVFVVTWEEPLVPPDNVVFPGRGVTACDFDQDGDQDVYVSNYRLEANYLWQNDGNGGINDVAQTCGVAGTYDGWRWSYGHSIGSAWGDMDNDGYIDLFVGNFSHPDSWQDRARFYRNLGPGDNWQFAQMWELTGKAWEESYASPALGDYDNDGDLDLYYSTVYSGDNARLWRNNGNWSFTDVTDAEGLGGMPKTYQAAWADIDNDGDLDLASGGRIYVNLGNSNHWLKVRLRGDGVTVNRSAIGAQVRIVLSGGIVITRQVEGGTGECNQNDLTLHFGLGVHSEPVDLEIFWPNGNVQHVITPIDRYIEVGMNTKPVADAGPDQTVTIDWVSVGNTGNANDSTGYGSVSEEYRIGKYEVTAGQYTEFLNAVAAADTHGLYNTSMWSSGFGCKIQRSGSSGSYTYSVASDYADRPVNYVSWYDCLRFANWLHNGQPTGSQDAATTEDGAYDMSLSSSVVRKAGAWIWLPSEDEWYKAAYHKNDGVMGNYFDYPASSDTAPGRDALETTNPGNNANYYDGDYLIGSPYYRTVVGEFELSDSPYGTFDMGGNVWEWNETLIFSGRGIRGGSYDDNDNYLRSSSRIHYNPDNEKNNMGFRVASVPVACPSADLTNDCFVNFEDFAKLAAQWLTGRQ
jgi:formylglycine-generating enzyme required for sulfatase activity